MSIFVGLSASLGLMFHPCFLEFSEIFLRFRVQIHLFFVNYHVISYTDHLHDVSAPFTHLRYQNPSRISASSHDYCMWQAHLHPHQPDFPAMLAQFASFHPAPLFTLQQSQLLLCFPTPHATNPESESLSLNLHVFSTPSAVQHFSTELLSSLCTLFWIKHAAAHLLGLLLVIIGFSTSTLFPTNSVSEGKADFIEH